MDFSISGVACNTPMRKPTPSAMIAMMAMNRPKPDLNSLRIVFPYLLMIHLLESPERGRFAAAFARLYHSMSETSAGDALVSMEETCPFLMWMTRSAICVSAELCVMTMTVFFSLRQTSCKSFKMDLPVS